MDTFNRALITALALVTAGSAHAETVVAKLSRGGLAKEVAQRQGVSLLGVTPDGRYARFGISDGANVSEKIARLKKDRGLASVDREQRFRTVQVAQPLYQSQPTLVKKGSTIPVVGDRAALKVANADLLKLINWNEASTAAPGRTLRVALLDTGIASGATTLWSKTVASANFVESGAEALDQPTGVDSNGNGIADEAVGHGTVVAGIVDLVSPQTKFVVARIANSEGYATTWTLLNGIQFAVANGAEVINISLAERRKVAVIEQALADAEARGIVVVGSIGNDNLNFVNEPADIPTVIAVAAVDLDAKKASFSNYHSRTNVSAPGTSLIGRDWTGDEVQWAGSSFSAAFVTGTIADVLRRCGTVSPAAVRSALTGSGRSLDAQNPVYKGKLGTLIDFQAFGVRLGAGR